MKIRPVVLVAISAAVSLGVIWGFAQKEFRASRTLVDSSLRVGPSDPTGGLTPDPTSIGGLEGSPAHADGVGGIFEKPAHPSTDRGLDDKNIPDSKTTNPGRNQRELSPSAPESASPSRRDFYKPQTPVKNAQGERPFDAAEPGVGEPIVPLPIAREALSLVGQDADAEAAWVQAINDPNLPAEARKDLIEDLNEEGFPDPKLLTANDLPLIRNRLTIIEALMEDPFDDVNADAFAEAYRDLIKMGEKASRM